MPRQTPINRGIKTMYHARDNAVDRVMLAYLRGLVDIAEGWGDTDEVCCGHDHWCCSYRGDRCCCDPVILVLTRGRAIHILPGGVAVLDPELREVELAD
jgi:hypothetical protein